MQLPAGDRLQTLLHLFQARHFLFGHLVDEVVVLRHQRPGLGIASGNDVEDIALEIGGNLLQQARNPEARTAVDRAGVGHQLAGNQLHQSGFTAAVASDQGQPFAWLDAQIDRFEQVAGPPKERVRS